jgi:UDP-glucose 4-epimerase
VARVLVTGGLGFLGRAVTLDLLEAGHLVTVLSRRPDPAAVTGDVRDRARMRELVTAGGYDAVCHLAALTRPRDSVADPLTYFDVNATGTLNLLLAVQPATRFVFVSTNQVCGSRHAEPLHEDLPPSPESPYAASKLAAEQLVAAYAATGAIGAVTLRLFNIAGAMAGVTDTDDTRIIPNTLRALTGELPYVTLNGDGSAVRDFVHLADVAAAVRRALDVASPGKHRVFHIGSGTGSSMADVVRAAEAAAGRAVAVQRMPPKPEPQRLVADNRRARDELGWVPARSDLARMVAEAWAAWPRPRGPLTSLI